MNFPTPTATKCYRHEVDDCPLCPHGKTSACPVCTKPFNVRAEKEEWNDDEWRRAFKRFGWLGLIGNYGREVFVCSKACAQKAMGPRS